MSSDVSINCMRQEPILAKFSMMSAHTFHYPCQLKQSFLKVFEGLKNNNNNNKQTNNIFRGIMESVQETLEPHM